MATPKPNVSLDAAKYIDRKQVGYAPGASNPKANFAFDVNVDGQQYTFIPDSTIQKGVTVDYEAVKDPKYKFSVPKEQFYFPWFANSENQRTLGQIGKKIDLSGSSIAGDLKEANASESGILVPRDSIDFSSNIRYLNLSSGEKPITALGSYNGEFVYKQDEKNFLGADGSQMTVGEAKKGGGGLFGTGIGPDIGWTDLRDTLQATGVVVGNYVLPGSSLLSSQLVSEGAKEKLATDEFRLANLGAGVTGGLQGNLSNYGSLTGGTTAGAGGLTGTDAAMADLAAGAPAIGAPAAATGAGLLGGTATDLTAQQTLDMIAAEQAGSMTAAETLAAIQAEQAAGGAAVIGGAGTGGTAAGLAGAGAGRALTSDELAKLGLVSGGLNLAGGLMQGETSKDALNQLAAQQKALAEKTLQMGKFQPVGVTTRFGTSSFTTDPVTGAITPSYTLSPEAKAYQDALSGMATQGLTAGQSLMNLGQGYIGESPEAVRNRYIQTQQALLAPQQEQTLAALRARQQATGRGGLATGATSDGLMATNPEMAAYYNSLAQTQRQLAANAETQYQNQVNFGTGLLGQATTPFTNVFGAQKGIELAAQQPLELSTNFANTVATRGAAQGANYATAMAPSLQAQYNANNYNPLATGLQGAASNPLTGYGLMKLTGLG